MKQVLIRKGNVHLEDVPAPRAEPGTMLIQLQHSCISVGTEMSGLKATGVPLWKRALQQPQHLKKVCDHLMKEGVAATRRLIQERIDVALPTGYSAAGVVLEVGAGVNQFAAGDRVACAGSQCAFHAEVVRVPQNLAVAIPDHVTTEWASSVALGAIALQGIRRAAPTLGETFVVIGLGILGQLTAQLLRANGCRVIGVDPDQSRLDLALQLGMPWGVNPDDTADPVKIARITGGVGADGVIITAASPSDKIISTAFHMCRKKARVVLVGDVGLNLQREDFYAKELDFLISTSYGPGRYDSAYEEAGLDYPLAYVRWTEGRNMAEYLRMIQEGTLRVGPLMTAVYPIDKAAEAYQALQATDQKPIVALLSYPVQAAHSPVRRIPLNPAIAHREHVPDQSVIRVALIGAGSFAKGMHLPNLASLPSEFRLRAVASRTGHNAHITAQQFAAEYCTTDYAEVFADKEVDAVIIATRHDSHATLALEALRAGKHVLLEKPLALEEHELQAIEDFYNEPSPPTKPVLLTGFNRRFSPYAERIATWVQKRSNPLIMNYRMNAGYIPLDHWVHGEEGGGRNRGEACHIYDLFTYLTQSAVQSVHATALKPATAYYSAADNFVATLQFEDGSVATLTYTALGHTQFPKETLDIFVDGKVITLNDYRNLTVVGAKHPAFSTRISNKGQKEELLAFAQAIKGQAPWPIPLWQQLQATRIGMQIEPFLNQTIKY